MTSTSRALPPRPGREIELILGAGGVKGFAHIGALQALEARKVSLGQITGVSVGSLVAAFYTNGYTADEILRIFHEGVERRNDPMVFLASLSLPDPLSFAIGGCLDLTPHMAELVSKYSLKPNGRLRVFCCDILRQTPVLFEGEGYDLARALAASCALPTVFRPVWHDGALCVDGAWYHYNPTDFVRESPAIVSAFTPARRLPQEPTLPVDLYFHLREMYLPIAAHRRYVDPAKHVLVEIDLPDVAGLNFGLSKQKRQAVVEAGRATTAAVIAEAIAAGRVPVAG